MLPLVKFCGLTRAADARVAGEVGGGFGGVIFAGGPRSISEAQAGVVLQSLPARVQRVGVMAGSDAREMSEMATRLGLDVIQLHSDPTAANVRALRSLWAGGIWAVVRGGDAPSGGTVKELFSCADAVVVDSGSRGTLGGTGQPLDWTAWAPLLASRGKARLVLAGGLTPLNVAVAIDSLHPDVVDVSSGVEVEVGKKDHAKMRAFMSAVGSSMGERIDG